MKFLLLITVVLMATFSAGAEELNGTYDCTFGKIWLKKTVTLVAKNGSDWEEEESEVYRTKTIIDGVTAQADYWPHQSGICLTVKHVKSGIYTYVCKEDYDKDELFVEVQLMTPKGEFYLRCSK